MKRTPILWMLALVLLLGTTSVRAQLVTVQLQHQLDVNLTIKRLEEQKLAVKKNEKQKLKDDLEDIHKKLEAGEISEAEAENLKRKAAEKHALNINNQLAIIEANIALLKRNQGKDSTYYQKMGFLNVEADTINIKKRDEPDKTSSGLFVAFGFSNMITKGQSLGDSPYKFAGSRTFEIGYLFHTVLVNSGFLRINYGLAVQFDGFKPDDNQYLVDVNGKTQLQTFPYDLKKSKFKMSNLLLPVHFELGPIDDDYYPRKFKIGFGGYVGINLNASQKLKYRKDGHRYKTHPSGGYNTNDLLYGLSAYVGYDDVALYVKYGLNEVFKNNPNEQHYVSLGVRVEL